jgi:hypothetical protein
MVSQVVHSQVVASTDATVNSPKVFGVDIGPVAGQGTGTDRTITLRESPQNDANGKTVNAEHLPHTSAEQITATELQQRSIRAVAIMLAESGGIPNAYNTNKGGSAPGSHDRGLAQWNDVAFPWITDAEAFDPAACISYMYYVSGHFKQWGPWVGSRGLDNTSDAYKLAAATDKNRSGIATPADDPLTGLAVAVGTTLTKLDLGDLIALAGKALQALTTATFWRRFGIGALGVLLVIFAVVLFARST